MNRRIVAWFHGRPDRIAGAPLAVCLVLVSVFARTRFAPAALSFFCYTRATLYAITLALLLSFRAALPAFALRRAFLWATRGLDSPAPESPRTATLPQLARHFVALVLVSWLAFSVNRSALLGNYDGAFLRVTTDRDFEWATWGPYHGMNPLSGLGNVTFCIRTRYSPGLALGAFAGGGELNAIVTYGITAVETFVAMLFLGWCLGLGATVMLASAWGLTLASLPFQPATATYYTALLSPTTIECIAVQAVMVGALYRMGEHGWGRAWTACVLLLAASILWIFVSGVFYPILSAPSLVVFGAVFVLGSSSRKELAARLAGLGILIALAVPTVLPHFIGSLSYSVPTFFSAELGNDRRDLHWVSGLFHPAGDGWLTRPLVVLGLAGAIVAAFAAEGGLRRVAIATLVQLGAILGVGLYATYLARDYRGPSLLYFEFFLWPFYWLFACYGVAVVGPRAIREVRRVAAGSSPVRPGAVLACAAAPLLAGWIVVSFRDDPREAFPQFPRGETTIVRRLEEAIGLHPGDGFRGSVATFTGYQGRPAGVRWVELLGNDFSICDRTGNDHRAIGLWAYGIPTLHEYNQLMTPAYYAMMSRMLARPVDEQVRTVIVMTRPDLPYLRSLGVRFIITDFPVTDPGATLVETLPVLGLRELRLYELTRPNLATYSPTKVSVAADATALLARLEAPGFDYTEDAVAFDALPPGLEHAARSGLRFEKDRCVIEAESHGRSLLLLPLQFSHCLELAVRSPSVPAEAPRLVRLNLMQAGLLFSGATEVELRLRSGPFHNPYGRLQDYRDMKNVRLEELPPTGGAR